MLRKLLRLIQGLTGTAEKKEPADVVARLRYNPYDPERPTPAQRELLVQLENMRAARNIKDDDWLTVAGFDNFAMMTAMGRPRLCYDSHLIAGGLMFWLTDAHAKAIGQALRPSLKALRLNLTRPQEDGFTLMAGAVAPGVKISELYISHRSGDEVTATEARGIARLAGRLACETLHVWAGEFDPGALDALADELGKLGNKTLRAADVCDVSKPEPEDRIIHPGLRALAEANSA